MIGERIGEYDIIELIGEGGMATVYKARQPSVERLVAIKLLPRQLSEDPSFIRRFQHEARVIAHLEHRSILPIYAYGEQDGMPYIVMRLLEAGSLRRRLFQGQLDLPTTARVVEQVGEALDYAHSQGVIHRDLKPSNILLDENENAYLTDFGIAKMLGASSTQITGEGVVGTPTYMSPEQCQGKSATPASDIYALGAILFELVTGEPPFVADTPLAVMYMQVKEPVPSVQSIDPNLPALVDRVILKAMAKNPKARFSSGAALAAAFRRAIGPAGVGSVRARATNGSAKEQKREQIQERAASRRQRAQASAPRNTLPRTIALAVVLVLVMLAAGLSVRSLLRGDAEQAEAPTSTSPVAPTATQVEVAVPVIPTITPGAIIEPTTEPGPSEEGETSPSVTPILQPTSPAQATGIPVGLTNGPGRLTFTEGNNEASEIAVMNEDGSNRVIVTDNDTYDGEPDFSPDGTRIAFESARFGNIDLLVMNASGENVRRLTDSPQPDRHPDWSPDGRIVAYESGIGNTSEIFAISADGNSEPVQLTTNGYGDRAPQFSPDGTLIAFMTERRGRWQIALMRYPGGEQVTLFDCPATDCRFPTWSPDGKLIAFNTINTGGQVDAIYTLNPATGDTEVLIEGGQNGRPVFNGNGSLIFFNRAIEGISGIFQFAAEGKEITRVTNPEIDVYAPDWGPQ